MVGAHERLSAPWKELLTYYQMMWDSRIKFDQVVAQFDPAGMRDEALQSEEPAEPLELRGTFRAINLSLTGEDGETLLDGASFALDLPARVAIVGPGGSGKEELTLLLANLIDPTSGRVLVGEKELHKLPEAVTGRQITYVGYPAQIFAGSIADNLFFGLKHRPVGPYEATGAAAEQHRRDRHETQRSGNSPYDSQADWIDYREAGLDGPHEITLAAVGALTAVQLDRDVYHMGLRGTIDAKAHPDLAARLLEARRAMLERLQDPKLGRLVEVFDPERYNTNATLAENLLFGTPIGEAFDVERLASQPYVKRVIERAGFGDRLLEVGFQLASTMVELFADLPPDHEYFRQFSFIGADDLPDYRALVGRAEPGRLGDLRQEDRDRLIALTFKLIPARHRLDLIDEDLQRRDSRGAPPAPGGSAQGARGRDRLLPGRPLQCCGQPPGQHPVRQGRLRPGAGDRAH